METTIIFGLYRGYSWRMLRTGETDQQKRREALLCSTSLDLLTSMSLSSGCTSDPLHCNMLQHLARSTSIGLIWGL